MVQPTQRVDLEVLGDAVRAERQRLGLSLRALAEASSLSERFVSDLERGRGNISIARLAQVADALGVSLQQLVAPLDAVRRAGRRRVVGLVGLRGAGKTSVGQALAERIGARFVELDQAIEARAALPLGQVFEIHGEAYYRRLEREALVDALERARTALVIATGGGLVSHDESWRVLRRLARTVWLRATPEDHYARVIAQGDLRPMKNRPSAMAELRALLGAREPRYREAELTVDTSALGLQGSVAAIVRWLDAA